MRETVWETGVQTDTCKDDSIEKILDKCNVNLTTKDKDYISTLYNANMNRYLLEYIYKLTINTLKKPLVDLGDRLIKGLCYVIDKGSLSGIPDIYIIALATKLELINKDEQLGLVELIELLQIQNYYNSATPVTREQTDYFIKFCFDAVLFKDFLPFDESFDGLVKELNSQCLVPLSEEYISIINATGHEKTVVARLLCALLFNFQGDSENFPIINNYKLLMPALWESIGASDKVFFAYYFKTLPENSIQRQVFKEISSTNTVKLPEFNTELNLVKHLIENGQDVISCHYSINNRRNETSALLNIKEHIYMPAIFSRSILTPAIIAYMGNEFGYIKDSRLISDYILQNISNEKWIYYLKNYFINDNNILIKLVLSKKCIEEWCNIVKNYIEPSIDIDVEDIKLLLEYSRQKKYQEVYMICCKLYYKKQTLDDSVYKLNFKE